VLCTYSTMRLKILETGRTDAILSACGSNGDVCCVLSIKTLNPGHQILPECSSRPMNPNNICQMVARLIRRLLSAKVSSDVRNAVLTDFAIMCKAKYLCFCERFTTAQKTHSSFERNKVFLQMKNRKMQKTCFEMKHK